jgi:hypothetical protein
VSLGKAEEKAGLLRSKWRDNFERLLNKKSAGAASLRGQGTPAYPARLRSERARNSSKKFSHREIKRPFKHSFCRGSRKMFESSCCRKPRNCCQFGLRIFAAAKDRAAVNQEAGDFPSRNSLLVFFAAKEFVALDSGNHADSAFFTGLGALYAPEAADAYRSGQSNLVGKRQKNLNG